MKQITKRSAGSENRRYLIWRGWDWDDGKLHSARNSRVFWTGCGWSPRNDSAKVFVGEGEVRTAITRMEADGLAVNAEVF